MFGCPYLTSPLSLCSYVLLELVETERDYVRDLGAVVEVRMRSNHRTVVSRIRFRGHLMPVSTGKV